MGPLLKEVYYRNAIEIGLKKHSLSYEVEKGFQVFYEGAQVGEYRVDVWIEKGKLLVELKVAPRVMPLHKAQAISYLKVTDADLALLVNYGEASLRIERLPNFLRDKQPTPLDPPPVPPDWIYPDVMEAIQRACYRVHGVLGTGFFHHIYRRAAMVEFERSGLSYEYRQEMPVIYEGYLFGNQDARLILVEGKVVVAAFALHTVADALKVRFRSYMRQLQMTCGMLVNFYGMKPEITVMT